jgi:hypothetical protein
MIDERRRYRRRATCGVRILSFGESLGTESLTEPSTFPKERRATGQLQPVGPAPESVWLANLKHDGADN